MTFQECNPTLHFLSETHQQLSVNLEENIPNALTAPGPACTVWPSCTSSLITLALRWPAICSWIVPLWLLLPWHFLSPWLFGDWRVLISQKFLDRLSLTWLSEACHSGPPPTSAICPHPVTPPWHLPPWKPSGLLFVSSTRGKLPGTGAVSLVYFVSSVCTQKAICKHCSFG